MLPEGFVKRIKTQHYIDASSLVRSLQEPSSVSIRVNRAKWKNFPVDSQPVTWCNEGWYLKSHPSFTCDPLFHAGCYYAQEASGMFLEVVFKRLFKDNTDLKILDLCGAPGGKSTHLASLVGDRGCLVTNEVIRSRASVLAENITRWGLHNTLVTNNDPSAFTKLNGFFDMIVVDAPCSGEGMFRDKTAVREWKESNAAMCSERQRRIVMDVWPALKQGGIMIYSTCTFNPAENEENVKWFSDKTDATCLPVDISKYKGVREIRHEDIIGYGFYPGLIRGEGFFLAVLKKKQYTENKKNNGNIRRKADSISNEDLRITEALVGRFPDRVFRQDNNVWLLAVPVHEYRYLENYLRIIKRGVQLFKIKGSALVPAHDLALSVVLLDGSFPVYDLNYGEALKFLRRSEFRVDNMVTGWVIAAYKGVKLGFMKNLGSRINNYYPVDWRIRTDNCPGNEKDIIQWNE